MSFADLGGDDDDDENLTMDPADELYAILHLLCSVVERHWVGRAAELWKIHQPSFGVQAQSKKISGFEQPQTIRPDSRFVC